MMYPIICETSNKYIIDNMTKYYFEYFDSYYWPHDIFRKSKKKQIFYLLPQFKKIFMTMYILKLKSLKVHKIPLHIIM